MKNHKYIAKTATDSVAKQIAKSEAIGDSGVGKALLANLRRAAGRDLQKNPDIWGMVLEDLPVPEYDSPEIMPEEMAVFISMTLYAVAQQGESPVTHSMHQKDVSFGAACGQLAGSDENQQERVRAKLKRLLGAKNMDELAEQLRRMIQLIKAEDIKLDYAKLCNDLYWYQFTNGRDNVQLQWARDFTRSMKHNTEEKKEEEENNG